MFDYRARAVLLDIEGTTTSISFVKDELFPYAIEHAKEFLDETWEDATTKEVVNNLQVLNEFNEFKQNTNEDSLDISSKIIADFVKYLTDLDLKLGPFKTLQGMIWKKGYEDGKLKGHLFDDCFSAFFNWNSVDLNVAIYSSGSVAAQKLLFSHSVSGDLSPVISHYFDTTIGNKRVPESYIQIAKEMGLVIREIVFLTDVWEEAKAAKQAGMQVIIMLRPGNAPLTEQQLKGFDTATNFLEFKIFP
ncbi:enolase-phosphatase E1-like [Teleopsis dalmanni]|uniref:enolase-phosphatase E1 n=1 Tax=Teleopsis dalmanni TaxID=139649 RepID=UPI000D32C209|nr:enolase-phosphatase E1 [Teleopsis dalmanni]XP_037950291.1 enolase-phosphatase E1-like [Teleopsis dalmanni]